MKKREKFWLVLDKDGRPARVGTGKKTMPTLAIFTTRAAARACVTTNPKTASRVLPVTLSGSFSAG